MLQSRCQGKVDGTALGVIIFRLTENTILMNEISENTLNEELNKLFLVKIQSKENYEYDMEIQNLERRNSEYTFFLSHNESLNLKDDNYWKPINGQIKLRVREYTCVVNWR